MTNRVAATYKGTSTTTTHTITFSAPAAGSRLILMAASYYDITTPSGWTQEVLARGWNPVYVFTKIATGTETSVSLVISQGDSRVHAVLYEQDNAPNLLVTTASTDGTGTSASAAATVPAAGAGRVYALVNTYAASSASWNQGLAQDHSATAASCNSYFAAGALPSPGSQTYTVSGLTSNTNQHAFVVVSYGVLDGTPPTVPGNLRVTSLGGTSVTVAWDASTDNVGVTGYGIYKGGVKQGADQTALTATLSGLTPGQTYTVEVDAVDAANNRSGKASISVTTDGTPPTVPANLRVTASTFSSISFAWDASTDNIGVTGYGIYKGGVKQGADQTALTATFSGLTAGQSVVIGVDARDAAGNRSARAELTATATPDTTAPTVPPNLRTTAVGPYSVSVAWDASTDDVGVAGYGVYKDAVQQGPDQTGRTAVLSGLTPGTGYLIEVDAVDAAANRSARATLPVTTPPDLPPGPPGNLRSTDVTYTSITVAWDAAVDDVAVTGYDVRLDGALVVTNQPGLTRVFASLVENTSYLVEVAAVDGAGQRSGFAQLVVATLDDTDPTAPVLTVVPGEDNLDVSWSAATDDFGVTGYDVRLDGETVWTTPGVDYTVDGPRVRSHTITGLISGTEYEVAVVARDTIGQASPDNTATVSTLPVPYLPVSTPVYRLAGWAGNVRDEHGVTWVVKKPEGWSSTPPVAPVQAPVGGRDGAHAGAGRYGARLIVLEGVAVAPTRAAMLAAQQRITGVLHPRASTMLRVEDARTVRQARVRLVDRVEITDQGSRAFEWRIVLSASDPRRYATVPVSAQAVIASLPGSAQAVLNLAGNYPKIPARMRIYGPVRNWTVTHVESGTVLRGRAGLSLPADPDYSLTVDLGTRMVWAHVPASVWPQPRPGRSALAHLPAWFRLIPGTNTLEFAGEPSGEGGSPRLIVEAYPAWT